MDPKTLTDVLDLLNLPQVTSRNRNWARFSGEAGLRVWRLYRIYLSLLRDLEQAVHEPDTRVMAKNNGNGLRIELCNQRLHCHRINDVPRILAPFFMERLDGLHKARAL